MEETKVSGAKRLRLFHMSDLHFGLEDKAALAWAKNAILEDRPDAVIITGDLTMRARHREFEAAKAWINDLPCPVALCIGNHDMPYFNPVERLVAPYRRFEGMRAHVERELDLPGLAIIPLKTAVRAQPRLNWSKGWVSRRALQECLDALDALAPGMRALVTVHHPLRETGTAGTALTGRGARALEALAARGVLGVLSGHVHDPFDILEPTPRGPVRMIGAGTLSERTRATPAGFNVLRITEEGLTAEVRAMEGTGAFSR